MSRIDVVGQNGNDGLHYEEKDIDKEWEQMKPMGKEFKYEPDDGQLTDEQYAKIKEYEYELDKSTGEVVKKYPDLFKEVNKPDYSPEFTYWFERIYLQSPRMCDLQYDDEKMWEAWKAAKELGVKDVEL